MRDRRAVMCILAVLATAVLGPLVQTAEVAAAPATRVSLAITSGVPAPVGSTVTLSATVTPAGATGSVVFTVDERLLTTVALVGGKATTSVRVPKAGQFLIRAAFTPSVTASGFTSAKSAAATLVVGDAPRLVVQDQAGTTVAPGTPLAGGSTVKLVVQRFPARSTIRFTIGSASLSGSVRTDSRGAATLTTKIPALDEREYLIVAYGGLTSAVATIVVVGLVPGASPTPTFCPATTPPPTESSTPTPTSSSRTPTPTTSSPKPTSSSPRPTKTSPRPTESDEATATRSRSASKSDDDDLPGTGGNLPGTGAAILSLLVLAGLAFGIGTGLITIGRRPAGRHAR